ncbi:hypothetical protein ABGB17_05090 [Sphaerisporangium sp. B11E5]|uniref:hypothetical protein n=1 Tax=Sphaerisporangium sp. B11E5 TaxID=3153563 RepID=UPI00325CE1FD
MTAETTSDLWSFRAQARVVRTSGPFARHFVRHAARQPYRRGLPVHGETSGIRVKARIRAALYDAVINLFLDGYTELAGHPLRRETGPLMIRLNRLISAFDDAYERGLTAGGSLRFGAVFAEARVQERLDVLVGFFGQHPERFAVRDFLMARISSQYHRYVKITTAPPASRSFQEDLESAVLDSGGFAECFAHVVAILHGARACERTTEQFGHVGILAKLADDVVDFWDDLAAGRINLLASLIREHPDEYQQLTVTAPQQRRTGIGWWRATCPASFERFTALVSEHKAAVLAPSLSLACDIMLVQVRQGAPMLRGAPAGIRV